MATRLFIRLALALVVGGLALSADAEPTVGEPAPPFELLGSDGDIHSLEAAKGKRAVVLAWFPKAFTPG